MKGFLYMKWTSLNDLREKYLSFFESKDHLRLPSFPLVPINDKSLLLINSGMAPMKKYFTGEEEPPRHRVTTCQKCIRTPDLERVGHTARHGTFFEMLGNFSFGDYFKNEAIPWAWEFLTKTLEIPEDKLWPSIYENDEEAFELWNKVVGVPPSVSQDSAKPITSGSMAQVPAVPAPRYTLTEAKNTVAETPIAAPAATATDIWRSGTTYFHSSTATETEITPSWQQRTLIQEWVLNVSLA